MPHLDPAEPAYAILSPESASWFAVFGDDRERSNAAVEAAVLFQDSVLAARYASTDVRTTIINRAAAARVAPSRSELEAADAAITRDKERHERAVKATDEVAAERARCTRIVKVLGACAVRAPKWHPTPPPSGRDCAGREW